MRSRILAISVLVVLFNWCDSALAYKIHAQADTVYVHAKRGATGQPSNLVVISSRRGEDTATFLKQGYDTIRVSLSGSSDFAWATWQKTTIPYLGDRGLYLEYTPTSLTPSNAIVTVVGDSNTIQIVVIGIPDTNYQCLRIGYGPLPPSIPEGGTGLTIDTLLNLTDSSLVIDSIKTISQANAGDSNIFTIISPALPQNIAPHSEMILSIRATLPIPAVTRYFGVNQEIWVHGTSLDGATCATVMSNAVALLLVPWDTILVDLPPSASDTLTLNVHAAITGHALVFRNATAGRIFLQDMQITDTSFAATFNAFAGPHCRHAIASQKKFCFDDTLLASATSDTVLMMLREPDSGTYNVNLSVNYANALTAQTYTIRTHYVRPERSGVPVSRPVTSADFSMRPNPARDEVTISLPSYGQSTIEIFDVLGNLMIRQNASGEFVWRGESLAGQFVPNGTYIIRVGQRAPDGSASTQSKRLMLMR